MMKGKANGTNTVSSPYLSHTLTCSRRFRQRRNFHTSFFVQVLALMVLVVLLGSSSLPLAESPSALTVTRQRMSNAMEGYSRFQFSQSPDDLKASSQALFYSLRLNGMSAQEAIEIRRAYLQDYVLLYELLCR